jgi:cytochrome P450
LHKFIPRFLSNPIRAIPEVVYETPYFVPPTLFGRYIWITDPALVERVLLKEQADFTKTEIERRIFDAIVGGGLLTTTGEDWRWQRRLLAPLFRPSELLTFVPAISQSARRMVDTWQSAPDRTRRAIDIDMTDVTFDVLTSTLFPGATEAEQRILKTEIGAYLERTSWEIVYAMFRVPARIWHPNKRAMRHSATRLNEAVRALIAREKAAGWPSGGITARLGLAVDPDTGQSMRDDVIAANLATFAAAGHETTAKALTWALYLLARAPQWQERIRAEVAQVAGRDAISGAHVDRLVVTRQVLNEAMRLYPPAPVLTRQTVKPVRIGSIDLAKGAVVVMPIYVIHRHRGLWNDPDLFDPERFAPEREKAYLRTQFMPFGFGPRTCIGLSFAMIEGVVLLAEFVRGAQFRWDGVHAPEPVSRVTLRPRGGMPLAVDSIA